MSRCFMIQPFDGGKFDKRYEEIFKPAIKSADLEAYRVDRDPRSTIPIEDIESEIASSAACLADITTDNPNVWFELGYAIASKKPVVLICSNERKTPFPFDVQHRTIIQYSTDSMSDFTQLGQQSTVKLKALIEKDNRIGQVASMSAVAPVEGLEQHEIATLIAVAQQLNDPTGAVAIYYVRQDMEKAGFTKIATTLGIRTLLEKKMLETLVETDFNGEPYTAFRVTGPGMAWLHENRSKLKLREVRIVISEATVPPDDIPF